MELLDLRELMVKLDLPVPSEQMVKLELLDLPVPAELMVKLELLDP